MTWTTVVRHVSLSPLGPVDLSFQALSGRLKFTVRRHETNEDSFSRPGAGRTTNPERTPYRVQGRGIEAARQLALWAQDRFGIVPLLSDAETMSVEGGHGGEMVLGGDVRLQPLSACLTVRDLFWPWLPDQSHSNPFEFLSLSLSLSFSLSISLSHSISLSLTHTFSHGGERAWRRDGARRRRAFAAPPLTLTGRVVLFIPALEATQRRVDGFFSQLPYKCHQTRVASVGD